MGKANSQGAFHRIKNRCREAGLFLFVAEDRQRKPMWQFYSTTTGRLILTYWPSTAGWLTPREERGEGTPEEAFAFAQQRSTTHRNEHIAT